MRLCFIGGGNSLAGELDDAKKYLSNYIGSESKILIIPFATEESRIDRWFYTAIKFFEDMGVKHIRFLDYQLTNQDMQYEIKEHNVLYLTGGRPEKLMEGLKGNELLKVIKEFPGLMIGVSAGALVFCKECIITKDNDYLETQLIKGLGLVDFSVEVHYDVKIDEELLPLSDKRDIYAIPNGSAIFWIDEKFTAINSVFHFKDRIKSICL